MKSPFPIVDVFDKAKTGTAVSITELRDGVTFFHILQWCDQTCRGKVEVAEMRKTCKFYSSENIKGYFRNDRKALENKTKIPSQIIETPSYTFFFERPSDATLFRLKWA